MERLDVIEIDDFDNFARDVQKELQHIIGNHRELRLVLKNPWYQMGGNGCYTSPDFEQGKPYILDPSNPYNNLYRSGLKPFQARNDYCHQGVGQDKWDVLAANIRRLDLTKSLWDE